MRAHVEAKEQTVVAGALLLPCRWWGFVPCPKARQQVPLFFGTRKGFDNIFHKCAQTDATNNLRDSKQ